MKFAYKLFRAYGNTPMQSLKKAWLFVRGKRVPVYARVKVWGFLILILIGGCVSSSAQTVDCPADKVCLTQAQAAKYLTLEDTVKAQETEILALKQAILDQKLVTMDVKIELARTVGELTGAKQAIVRCDADKDLLVKYGRVRKFGLLVF